MDRLLPGLAGRAAQPLTEAFYYSGYTAATLGTGDLVPDHEALRLLSPIQSFAGFALLSIAVTYFLAVYTALIQKNALAATINSYFDETRIAMIPSCVRTADSSPT